MAHRCLHRGLLPHHGLTQVISRPLANLNAVSLIRYPDNHVPMMGRCFQGGVLPRTPHFPRRTGITLRDDPVYRLRSLLLPIILLGFLPLESSAQHRVRKGVTPPRNQTFQPNGGASPEHHCPSLVRSVGHVSPPRLDKERPHVGNPRPTRHRDLGGILHPAPIVRIRRSKV